MKSKPTTILLKSLTKQLKSLAVENQKAEKKALDSRFARIASGKPVTYKLEG